MQTLQSYTECNTSFVVQKSVVMQVDGACISSGIGLLEACTGILEHSWAFLSKLFGGLC